LAGIDPATLPIAVTVNNGVISVPARQQPARRRGSSRWRSTLCPMQATATIDVTIPSLTITPVDGGAGPDRFEINGSDRPVEQPCNTPMTVIWPARATFNFQTDDTAQPTP
jgi:hypothetical protein